MVRSTVKRALKSLEVEIFEAENGQEGLESVDSKNPDLILLDLTMPVMDGPEMLKRLREKGDKRPVILLTAESKTSIISELMKQGFQDYIVKPFQADMLKDKVAKTLKLGGGDSELAEALDVVLISDKKQRQDLFTQTLPTTLVGKVAEDRTAAMKLFKEHERVRMCFVDGEVGEFNVASMVRQLKILQRDAAFIALLPREKRGDDDAISELGCSTALFGPLDTVSINDSVAESLGTKPLVRVEENKISVSAFVGQEDRQRRYFTRLRMQLKDALKEIKDSVAVVDLSPLPENKDLASGLVQEIEKTGQEARVSVRFVLGAENRSEEGTFYDDVAAALAAS